MYENEDVAFLYPYEAFNFIQATALYTFHSYVADFSYTKSRICEDYLSQLYLMKVFKEDI